MLLLYSFAWDATTSRRYMSAQDSVFKLLRVDT